MWVCLHKYIFFSTNLMIPIYKWVSAHTHTHIYNESAKMTAKLCRAVMQKGLFLFM